MEKRKKVEAVREFYVPYEVTLRADVIIEATSAEEAVAKADSGDWDDDSFLARAEICNWRVRGAAQEASQ